MHQLQLISESVRKARARRIRHYYRHKQKILEYGRRYAKTPVGRKGAHRRMSKWLSADPGNIIKMKTASARWYLRIKVERQEEFVVAYGGKCSCCGESNRKFLTIEHLNGGGHKERQSEGINTLTLLSRLKKRGWPKEYTVLCFNCNCGKNRNKGVCPHLETNDSLVIAKLVGI